MLWSHWKEPYSFGHSGRCLWNPDISWKGKRKPCGARWGQPFTPETVPGELDTAQLRDPSGSHSALRSNSSHSLSLWLSWIHWLLHTDIQSQALAVGSWMVWPWGGPSGNKRQELVLQARLEEWNQRLWLGEEAAWPQTGPECPKERVPASLIVLIRKRWSSWHAWAFPVMTPYSSEWSVGFKTLTGDIAGHSVVASSRPSWREAWDKRSKGSETACCFTCHSAGDGSRKGSCSESFGKQKLPQAPSMLHRVWGSELCALSTGGAEDSVRGLQQRRGPAAVSLPFSVQAHRVLETLCSLSESHNNPAQTMSSRFPEDSET